MKKKILFPILSSLFLLFGSCENNFDAHIYGDLIQGKYPSTEDEYVSYMMTCYIPFTSVFTYQINSGTAWFLYRYRGQYSYVRLYVGYNGTGRSEM